MTRVVSWADLAALGVDRQPDAAEALTRPDDGLVLLSGGRVLASAALWWRGSLAGTVGRVGRIGHATWADADAGGALLAAAVERLAAEGARHLVGPMDGSTWFGYRVVTDAAPGGVEAPRFVLEPWPEAVIGLAFRHAGFAPVAHYLSSRVARLPDESARSAADLDRLRQRGVTVRPLRLAEPAAELEALHGLLLRAFAGNPYYAPLDLERFRALYGPLVARVDPNLVLVAEAEGPVSGADRHPAHGDRQPVGVLLAVPDAAQGMRGEPVDTVVLKTLAVDPAWRREGLGGALTRAVHDAARRAGYRSAVHALMHVENPSTRIGAAAVPIRRYALLGRDL